MYGGISPSISTLTQKKPPTVSSQRNAVGGFALSAVDWGAFTP